MEFPSPRRETKAPQRRVPAFPLRPRTRPLPPPPGQPRLLRARPRRIRQAGGRMRLGLPLGRMLLRPRRVVPPRIRGTLRLEALRRGLPRPILPPLARLRRRYARPCLLRTRAANGGRPDSPSPRRRPFPRGTRHPLVRPAVLLGQHLPSGPAPNGGPEGRRNASGPCRLLRICRQPRHDGRRPRA